MTAESEYRIISRYLEVGGQTLQRWQLYKGVELVGQFTSRDTARAFAAKAQAHE